jgi:outer membrane biosynthesis protein TonB
VQTQGSLRDGGLATLLQSMQAERATGTLTIDNGGDNCSLYFLFGHLFHASGPGGQGEEVVIDALGWDDGSYQFDPRAKLPAEETIKASPAELIAAAESRAPAAAPSTGASTWPDAAPAYSTPDTYSPAPAASLPEPIEEPAYAVSAPAPEPEPTPEPVAEAPAAAPEPEPEPEPELVAEVQSAPEAPAPEPFSYQPAPDPVSYQPEPVAAEPEPVAPAASAAASPDRPTPSPGGAATDAPAVRVYPLPSGRAHYEGLKSAFVDFPRLLRTLRSDRHTGYVNLSGTGYSGVILLNEGQALEALCSNGTAVQGEDAFLQIRRHMDAGDGVIDVIELDGETVTALAQLFTSPYLYSGLLGRFVNLEALLEYLAEEHVSGSVVVQTPNEAGIILLRDGDILGTYTESQRSLEKATTAVASLATDRASVIEVKGGDGAVAAIDVDAALNRAY